MNSRDSIEKLLQLGKARLKLDLGIVSQIEDQIYTVRYCSSNPYWHPDSNQFQDLGHPELFLPTAALSAIPG